MFDYVIFYEARNGTPGFWNVAPTADSHLSISGDNLTVPDLNQLMLATVTSQTATAGAITSARIKSPSMGKTSDIDVAVFETTGTTLPIVGSPCPLNNYLVSNRRLTPGEFLQFLTINSGTNSEETVAQIALGDGNYNNPYAGLPVETLLATSATTATAHAWTACSLTFSQALRAGTYAIVGMKAMGVSAIGARLIFANQGARPGCPAYLTESDIDNPIFRNGNLGVWGTFSHNNVPQLEIFADAADTAQQVYLDVVKIG